MESQDRITSIVTTIASIARGTKRKLLFFLLISFSATMYLALKSLSAESALWWNLIKCFMISMPLLIWFFIWRVLGQLEEAPDLVSNLVSDEDGVFSNLEHLSMSEPSGLRGVYSSIKEFRDEDGLSIVFETISGISLLVNPLFALVALLSLVGLSMLILVSLLLVIF